MVFNAKMQAVTPLFPNAGFERFGELDFLRTASLTDGPFPHRLSERGTSLKSSVQWSTVFPKVSRFVFPEKCV